MPHLAFLDNHELFARNTDRYSRDGLHLSDFGSKQLAIHIRTRIQVCEWATNVLMASHVMTSPFYVSGGVDINGERCDACAQSIE